MFMQRNEKCTYKFNAVVPLLFCIYVTLAVQVLPADRMSLPSYQIKIKKNQNRNLLDSRDAYYFASL